MAQIQCNFFAYSLGYPVDIQITLPSFTSCNMGNPHTHALPGQFPVLYLLHGYGNDYKAWARYTSMERYAEEHRIAVVTFSCHNKAYLNAPLGENFYDFLNEELPEFVESYFPISSNPQERYIAGLSMGGYGAMLHGLTNPERYSAIGAFSPGIPDPDSAADPNRIMRIDLYEVTRKALESCVQLPDLFICIGDKDFLYERVTRYHQTFGANWPISRYRYDDLPDYEHEFAIWDKEIQAFLDWIKREDVYKKLGKNKV
jgi:S-formylglutathione hydrolase FrmB